MTTLGIARPEPRDVVLAIEADARMGEALDEIEKLKDRLRDITSEVEAAEQRSVTAPNDVELPESAQLTLQFVDDLVTTNRERMRDQVSQRYAWVGDRLADAHADAQAIVGEGLDELSAAICEHDAARPRHIDDLPLAALMASVAPSAPTVTGTVVETGKDAAVEPDPDAGAAGDPVAEPGAAPHEAPVDEAMGPGTDAPELATTALALATEDEPATTLDGVVDSAVQAILNALTDPGIEATPLAVSATGVPASTMAPDQLGGLVGDDPGALPGDFDALSEDGLTRGYADFWGEKATAKESPRKRFRPRDVIISMLILVALAAAALIFIG